MVKYAVTGDVEKLLMNAIKHVHQDQFVVIVVHDYKDGEFLIAAEDSNIVIYFHDIVLKLVDHLASLRSKPTRCTLLA